MQLSKYFEKNRLSLTIIIVGFIILVCGILLHPWDHEWKNFVLSYDYLQGKGTILRSVLSVVVSFGKGVCMVFFILLIGAKGKRTKAFRIFTSVLIMATIVWVLKPTIHRERPNKENCVSFPSGDTATASAFLGNIVTQSPALAPIYILAPAVGFCRTYSNWHYLSDVVAGLACGLIAVGLAGMVRIRKVKILKKIKPRHFVFVLIILLLSTLLPGIIKGGGYFLDFFEFYGPASIILLAACYSSIFVFKHTTKKNIFTKLFSIKRKFNNYFYKTINRNCKLFFNKLTATIIILISFTMLYLSWTTIHFQKMRLSTSGLALALLITVFILYKQYSNPKNKRTAVYTLINSIAILIFFFIILFIPSVFRNHKYYVERIHKPQYSLVNRIFS